MALSYLNTFAIFIDDIACSELITFLISMTIAHPLTLSSTLNLALSILTHDSVRVTDIDRDHYCGYIREHIPDSVVSCWDPSCSKHCSGLDLACTQLLDCLAVGARRCLPKSRSNRSVVPEWNIQARSLRQSENFWYKMWCDCGCPTSGFYFRLK